MKITVQYLAQVKRAAGCCCETVSAAESVTLRDLLRDLAGRHDQAFRSLLIDDAEEPRRSLLFFVGDEHAELSRQLHDGDAITILAPMAGG